MGYSPWDHKKSDLTEQLTHTHSDYLPNFLCRLNNGISQRSASFLAKNQRVNILGLWGIIVSTATTQLNCYRVKVARDNTLRNVSVFPNIYIYIHQNLYFVEVCPDLQADVDRDWSPVVIKGESGHNIVELVLD